jgi:two-component system alkaline phosphatase synthesis response regulator PhoP
MPQLNATGTLALIVEDDPATRALEKEILEGAGFIAFTANNGEDGIRFATDRRPSVILLDLALPTVSGFDVLKTLKSSPVTANIPVVLISAYAMLVDNCLARGASACVQKPFDIDDLVAQVTHALKMAVDLKPIGVATYT